MKSFLLSAAIMFVFMMTSTHACWLYYIILIFIFYWSTFPLPLIFFSSNCSPYQTFFFLSFLLFVCNTCQFALQWHKTNKCGKHIPFFVGNIPLCFKIKRQNSSGTQQYIILLLSWWLHVSVTWWSSDRNM